MGRPLLATDALSRTKHTVGKRMGKGSNTTLDLTLESGFPGFQPQESFPAW